ncbi:MAG: hypothetical protein ACLQVY_15085 [Limisphaerales bacterium]
MTETHYPAIKAKTVFGVNGYSGCSLPVNPYLLPSLGHLAEHFIFHGDVGLAADVVPEVSLDHEDGGLDIRPPVVMRQELAAFEAEKMIRHFKIPGSRFRQRWQDFAAPHILL